MTYKALVSLIVVLLLLLVITVFQGVLGNNHVISRLIITENKIIDSNENNGTLYINSKSTDIATNIDVFTTSQPIIIEDVSMLESTRVMAMETCNGLVWGRGSKSDKNNKQLYVLNPKGENSWNMVYEFENNEEITSLHCSQKSNYLFIGVYGGVLYRSKLANGSNDIEKVLIFKEPRVLNYIAQWSYTDAEDGRIWVAEYGGDKDGDIDDAIRVYLSSEEGEPGSFKEVFNLVEHAPYFSIGMHLHKIIYSPQNDTLYVAHGDDDPNYLFKLPNGTGTQVDIIDFNYTYATDLNLHLQPTSAEILPDGNIAWFDDAGRVGVWIHTLENDSFEFVTPSINLDQFFFDTEQIGNVIYAPTRTANESRNEIMLFNAHNLREFVVLKHEYLGTDEIQGWDFVAGKANDDHIYLGYRHGDIEGTTRISQSDVSLDYGIDVSKVNLIELIDFNKLSSQGTVIKATTDNQLYVQTDSFTSDIIDLHRTSSNPITVSAEVRSTKIGDYPSVLKLFTYLYNNGSLVGTLQSIESVQTYQVTNNYNSTVEFKLPSSEMTVDFNQIKFEIIASDDSFIDLFSLKLRNDNKLYDENVIKTTLDSPIDDSFTISGSIYLYDKISENTDGYITNLLDGTSTPILSLRILNGVVQVINNNEIFFELPLDPFILGDLPSIAPTGETVYWAITYNGNNEILRLFVSTQRNNTTIIEQKYKLDNSIEMILDGSLNGQKSIHGAILERSIHNKALDLNDIKTEWK